MLAISSKLSIIARGRNGRFLIVLGSSSSDSFFAIASGKDSSTVFGPRKMRARMDCWDSLPVFVRTAFRLSLLERTTQPIRMGFQFPEDPASLMNAGKRGLQLANLFLRKRSENNLITIAGAGGFGLPLLVAQHCLPRKLDLVAVLADALDEDLLSFFQFVTHVLDTAIGNFGDVQQT